MSVYTIFPVQGFVDPSNSQSSQVLGPPPPTEQVTLAFDALVSEAPEYSAEPTQSLVENGSVISDHVTLKPVKLTVQGIITDTPISYLKVLDTIASSFGGTLPSQKAFFYLENLYKTRAVFDFVGGFKIYTNMVISEWRPVRNPQTGSALVFSCTMTQVTIVNSQTLVDPANTKAAPKVSHGGQPLGPVSTTQQVTVVDAFGETLTKKAPGTLPIAAAPTVPTLGNVTNPFGNLPLVNNTAG